MSTHKDKEHNLSAVFIYNWYNPYVHNLFSQLQLQIEWSQPVESDRDIFNFMEAQCFQVYRSTDKLEQLIQEKELQSRARVVAPDSSACSCRTRHTNWNESFNHFLTK